MAEDVKQDSSPELEEAMEQEAAEEQQAQDTEQATPQQADSQEQEEEQPEVQEEEQEAEQRIPYDRFKEVNDERKWYRQQLEQQLQKNQTSQQPQRQEDDPYKGMSPEEKVFWENVDKRAEKIAEKKLKSINPMINSGLKEIAAMKVEQFRKNHPDVKANSVEEREIARRINQGYNPDDAYWAVVGPAGAQRAQQQAKMRDKKRFVQKKKANTESSAGVSQDVKTKPKKSIDDTFEEQWQQLYGGKNQL